MGGASSPTSHFQQSVLRGCSRDCLVRDRDRDFFVFETEIETRKVRDLLVKTETKQLRDRD